MAKFINKAKINQDMAALMPFIWAVLFSILGEIADKTQLVILGFALKYKAPFKVFWGGLLGHAVMDGIAIVIGTFAGFRFQAEWLKYAVGGLFIIAGLYGFYKMYGKKKGKDKERKITSASPFLITFLTILVTEIGDKTQVSSGLLAAEYKAPFVIFIGVTIGLAITIGLNVFVGSKLAEKLPRKAIKITTNVMFVIFGILNIALR